MTRRLDVQGLRAIAVFVVVAFHAGLPVPAGFLGVDIFFVISGFVIIGLLWAEVAGTGRIDFARFYTRRVRRILPALGLVVTLTVVAAWFLLTPLGTQQVTGITAIGAAWSVANWVIRAQTGDYFNEAAEVNPLLHTWSLSVEEQFYLVFPALLLGTWWLARRWRAGRAAVLALLAALGVASFAGAWLMTGPVAAQDTAAPLWAFYGSMFRVWEFALGGIVVVAARRRPRLPTWALRTIAGAGLVAIAGSVLLMGPATPTPGPSTAIPVLGTAAVIYAGAGTERGVVPGLASRFMVWLGDLSYSWYLWHWPFIVFVSVVTLQSRLWITVAAFGSLLPAWLAYRFLEQPIRYSGVRGWRVIAVGLVCVLVPTALGLTLVRQADGQVRSLAHAGHWVIGQRTDLGFLDSLSLYDRAALAQKGQWTTYGIPCLGDQVSTPGSCVFFEGPDKPRAVLIGDSHAGALSPGFLLAANELGYSAELITSPGCPFTTLPLYYQGAVQQDCIDHVEQVLKYLKQSPPDVVLIANRSPRFVQPPIALADELEPGGAPKCVANASGTGCLDHDAAVKAWSQALRDLLTELEANGSSPALFLTVPENERGPLACSRGRSIDVSCLQTPRQVSWDRRRDVVNAETAVADDLGVPYLDPFNRFCDATTCREYIDGQFMYRNDDHLSVFGSQWLAGDLKTLLRGVSPQTQQPTSPP